MGKTLDNIDEYTAGLLVQFRQTRQALVDQLVAGAEAPEFVRGQVRGLDRAITIALDASKAFLTVDADVPRLAARMRGGR